MRISAQAFPHLKQIRFEFVLRYALESRGESVAVVMVLICVCVCV